MLGFVLRRFYHVVVVRIRISFYWRNIILVDEYTER